ncbi:hypothetical protein GCM10007415_31720 [Parapedobacter pyrenivorans]|uniref:Uncharacterized protein n=1 Tax=Parapedobacter pyrenivorans TaxID=1305674 RepID=A0A917HXQ7_9SPHI|nr:hypothetical protein [Parapedobacter pyrenivorans]GGG94281.1 hypothetical protein GCM10007415_31720 [Parapedobacter pyrenivorans]
MSYKPWPHIPAIDMTLRIAEPTAEMLYPAKLELTYGSFAGEYELLLVKKNDGQLGIGRNKYPLVEEPFGLGPWMMYLNGVLERQQTDTDEESLMLKRLWLDNFGIFMRGLYDNEFYTNTKVFLRDFLYREDMVLARVDDTPWMHPHTQRMIDTDTIYYGVYDPIKSEQKVLSLAIQDEERYDRDTVTIVHNGKMLADRLPLEQAMALASITLDSGENYLAFFADNYGDLPPNTANFIIGTAGDRGQQYGFDFSDPSNAYSTVMVARFQYLPKIPQSPVRSIPPTDDEPSDTTDSNALTPARKMPVHTKGRRNQRIGQLKVGTEQVILELRDEQVEDGDIISLEVNGAVIADGMEVSRQGRRFGVSLKRGRNRIVFRAENLGRIPPNTAVLLVYADGEQRKFHLSTDFERNNVLDIIFEQNR